MLQKDMAICLRTTDFSETSQVVTMFARDAGKIDAMAKGTKRPRSAFEGPIEVLSYGSVIFLPASHGRLSTLTEFQRKPLFLHSKTNLIALNAALFAAELLNSLTTDFDPHERLFDSFVCFLEDIQQCRSDTEALALLILFQLTVLGETGSMPILNRCANCSADFTGRLDWTYFSSRANGLVCRNCEQSFADRIHIDRKAALALADLRLIPHAEPETIGSIEKLLVGHFTGLLGKAPKSAKFFLHRKRCY